MRIIATCLFSCACLIPVLAQSHPTSNAWSYVSGALSADGMYLVATTVAGTGGTDSHTIETVTIGVDSLEGRRTSANEYPSGAFTAQATTYFPLCGPTGCEDGNFLLWNLGTLERCGVTQTTLAIVLTQSTQVVDAFHYFDSVTFSPTAIAVVNGASTMQVVMTASKGCNGQTEIQASGGAAPSVMKWGFKEAIGGTFVGTGPQNKMIQLNPGSTANVSFYYGTHTDNASGGSIAATAAANITRACKLIKDEIKQLTLNVN